jgi:calcineurin-like phosphoesterase family protein
VRFTRSRRSLAIVAAAATVGLGAAGGVLTASAADVAAPVQAPPAAPAPAAPDPLRDIVDGLLGPRGALVSLLNALVSGFKPPLTSLPPVEDPAVGPPPAAPPVAPVDPAPAPPAPPPPPEPPAPAPPAPRPPVGNGTPVIAAAGDIACDPDNTRFLGGVGSSNSCRQMHTSDLLVAGNYDAVLTLGDTTYYCSSFDSFQRSFDPSWGRVKPAIRPVVGNHDYLTHRGTEAGGVGCDASNAGAAGYFKYFGAAAGAPTRGYYSYDLGGWHLIALNSQCGQVGGCGPSSPQGKWLAADLAANTKRCTLAYWHVPLFSSGGRAAPSMANSWAMLMAAGADVVLAGHDHTYERFAPMTATGARDDAKGIRSFVVGTGGANHTSFVSDAPNSEVRNDETYGILQMVLRPDGYDWQFVPEKGETFTDAGSNACH